MKHSLTRVIVILVFGILAACQPQETIQIVITPTPGPTDTPTETIEPTITNSPEPTSTLTPEPSLTDAPTDTDTPPTPTSTPNYTPTPIPTFLGPIIGEGYRLPTLPPGRRVTSVPTSIGGTPSDIQEIILPDLDPAQMGIQINVDRVESEWVFALDRSTQLGVGWIKVQINWQVYQSEGPSQTEGPSLKALDDFLRFANDRGINVMVSVVKAPRWARSTLGQDGPPDDPQALANFITILLNMHSGHTIDAVEIWNEPNLLREWIGQPLNGASYMRYFDAGYNAVRAFSPNMPVITAGLAPTGENPGISRSDRVFLQEMYDAGLGNYQGVFIGLHPYGWANPPDSRCCPTENRRGWDDDPHFFFLDNLEEMLAVMDANGDTDHQVWITEIGWATWDGLIGSPPELWMTWTDVWDQGEYIIRTFELAQQHPQVAVTFLWNLNYGTAQDIINGNEVAGYTIMPENGSRLRPAFWMIYDAVRPGIVLDTYLRDE